jgi:hypothetical protein
MVMFEPAVMLRVDFLCMLSWDLGDVHTSNQNNSYFTNQRHFIKQVHCRVVQFTAHNVNIVCWSLFTVWINLEPRMKSLTYELNMVKTCQLLTLSLIFKLLSNLKLKIQYCR